MGFSEWTPWFAAEQQRGSPFPSFKPTGISCQVWEITRCEEVNRDSENDDEPGTISWLSIWYAIKCGIGVEKIFFPDQEKKSGSRKKFRIKKQLNYI